MSETDSEPRVRNARPGAFLPAIALLTAVSVAMTVGIYEGLALQAIFASFLLGVCLTLLSQVLWLVTCGLQSAARISLAVGVSLIVAAMLLYLTFGCVFGCPG